MRTFRRKTRPDKHLICHIWITGMAMSVSARIYCFLYVSLPLVPSINKFNELQSYKWEVNDNKVFLKLFI